MSKQLIMIGGPRHGQITDDEGMVKQSFDQVPQGPLGIPGPAVTSTYIKRAMKVGTTDGTEFIRSLYIHESVSQQDFLPMFAQYLIGEWVVTGGEKLDNTQDVVPDRGREGLQQLEDGTSKTASGLFVAG